MAKLKKTGARTHRANIYLLFLCAKASYQSAQRRLLPKIPFYLRARSAAGGENDQRKILFYALLDINREAAFHFIHTKSAILLCHLILFVYIAARHLPSLGKKKIVPSLERERKAASRLLYSLLVYLSANCFQSIVSCAGGGIWMHRDEILLSYYHTSKRRKSVFIISMALPFNQISISSPPIKRNFHARR